MAGGKGQTREKDIVGQGKHEGRARRCVSCAGQKEGREMDGKPKAKTENSEKEWDDKKTKGKPTSERETVNERMVTK